jgi:cysteine desulfurase
MVEVMGRPLNPSSIHSAGRDARKLVEAARTKILKSVDAEALVFCSSGTESNNLALCQKPVHIISEIEHDSIYKATNTTCRIKVWQDGIVDLSHFEQLVSRETGGLVSIILANNETGVIQPIRELAALAKKYGHLVHTDAVQAFGKIPLGFKELGCDLMTISCHKIGGPVGVAALVHRKDLELVPFMKGGGQEKNKRPGTENVPAIIGFAASADLPKQSSELRDYLEGEIEKLGGVIVGKNSPRIPNTSCIIMPNMDAATQLIHFDTNGICVSSGSACSSGKVEVSRTLQAMGIANAKNAVRVSIGWNTARAEIDLFIKQWRAIKG